MKRKLTFRHVSDEKVIRRITELSEKFNLSESFIAQCLIEAGLQDKNFDAFVNAVLSAKSKSKAKSKSSRTIRKYMLNGEKLTHAQALLLNEIESLITSNSYVGSKTELRNRLPRFTYNKNLMETSLYHLADRGFIEVEIINPSRFKFVVKIDPTPKGIEMLRALRASKYLERYTV